MAFCILTLYSATVYSLISFNNFLIRIFEIFCIIMSSLYLPSQLVQLIFFLALLHWLGPQEGCYSNRHPCLAPDLGEKGFSLSLLHMTLAVGFS